MFRIAFLLALLPSVFQIIFGYLSIYKKTKIDFFIISLLSFLFQSISSFLAMKIVSEDATNQGIRCGMPSAAMFFWCLLIFLVLFFIIIVQLLIRRSVNKRAN